MCGITIAVTEGNGIIFSDGSACYIWHRITSSLSKDAITKTGRLLT